MTRRVLKMARAMVVLAGALAAAAGAQDLTLKAPPQGGAVAIVNATVHPISGPAIEHGYVVFEGGVIKLVGGGREGERPRGVGDARVIDGTGKHVYPGLIAPDTQLGLAEIGAVRATLDYTETGAVTPEVRAAVAVNPDSWLLPVTRSNGILTFVAMPTGGLVPGRASVMRMDGWTWEDMAIKPDAGLVIQWPQMRAVTAWWMDRSEREQQDDIKKSLESINRVFDSATAYYAAKDADAAMAGDSRWEAMRGVFARKETERRRDGETKIGGRQLPVFIYAADVDQITSAVTWAVDRKLRPVIVGGRDAVLAADLLKKYDVPVIVLGTHAFPKRDDSAYDEAFTLPARLEEAGVRWCMASADRTAHERNLPYNAATAVAYGLNADAALRALTLSTAEIMGVADRLGSLDAGKAATLIVTTGSPLEIRTRVEMAFIDGREIDLSNKQTKLEEKYREKYRQLKMLPEARKGDSIGRKGDGGAVGAAAGDGGGEKGTR